MGDKCARALRSVHLVRKLKSVKDTEPRWGQGSWEDYDTLTVNQVRFHVEDKAMSNSELRTLWAYESAHKGRENLLSSIEDGAGPSGRRAARAQGAELPLSASPRVCSSSSVEGSRARSRESPHASRRISNTKSWCG